MEDVKLMAGDQPHVCPACYCSGAGDCECTFHVQTDGNMKTKRRAQGGDASLSACDRGEVLVEKSISVVC